MPRLPLFTAALLACMLCMCTGEQLAQHAEDADAVLNVRQELDLRAVVCPAATGGPAAAIQHR